MHVCPSIGWARRCFQEPFAIEPSFQSLAANAGIIGQRMASTRKPLDRVAAVSQNPAMPKWFKAMLALVLLPLCAGAGWALWRVLRASGSADTIWVPAVAGAGCWAVIYWLLPKPMWVYVFGHEFTHALWTWMLGGRVKAFKASAQGGHVVVNRNNFLVALAPYFFPVYALMVVAAYAVGRRFWNWQAYVVWFHLLLGAAYAFHVTLTTHILKSEQTDLLEHGYFFSAVIIFLGNTVVLLLGIPLLTGTVDLLTVLRWWSGCTVEVVRAIGNLLGY